MLISPVPRIFCALVNGARGTLEEGGGGGGGGTGLAFRPGMEKGNFDRAPMMDLAAVKQWRLWRVDMRFPGSQAQTLREDPGLTVERADHREKIMRIMRK